MNKRTLQHCIIITQILTACLLICFVGVTWAQDTSKKFQETREDFLKALGKKPTSSLRAKGVQSKGPEEIVPDDYQKIIQNPIARSLILFDFDSDRVKEESYSILQNLADALTYDLPNAKLVVAGHTDSIGTEEYNMGLSRRRAKAVKDVLVFAYAIAADRLFLRWYGENQPIASNETKQGRAQNRRVEFIRVE